ncbi:MAG: hypothetical protein LBN93_01610 [Candidatus Symbiothrix sp.]|jgi:hypothetical protein|nr:hypothetical protein [Candidatus Symbiothrix sp.]
MECWSFTLSIVSILLAIFSVYWATVACRLKPNLEIGVPYIKNGKINVNVVNSDRRAAINIKVEICTVRGNDFTGYFKVDKGDFLMLPSKKDRVFKCEERPIDDNTIIRIRVYAANADSGFGKVFDAEFRYDAKTGKFEHTK